MNYLLPGLDGHSWQPAAERNLLDKPAFLLTKSVALGYAGHIFCCNGPVITTSVDR